MILSIISLLIFFLLFFYVLSPFFKEYEPIRNLKDQSEIELYLKSNLKEFEDDFELGKITKEELVKFEEDLKKEVENG